MGVVTLATAGTLFSLCFIAFLVGIVGTVSHLINKGQGGAALLFVLMAIFFCTGFMFELIEIQQSIFPGGLWLKLK